jgi:integrase/recombinase XerD
VPAEPLFIADERAALSGFRAGYSGLTRHAYTLDLRQYAACCAQHRLYLFTARRADIECFDRDMEAKGAGPGDDRSPAVHHRGVLPLRRREDLLEHSPAAHVRRPRLDYESHAAGLDRNEVGALLVAAGLGAAAEHALLSLLAINGLRISEALGADIDAHGLERGHRTLTVLRKAARSSPFPSPTHRDGRRMDRHAAGRIVRRLAKRGGIDKKIGPHTLRHAFITAALDAGVPLRHVQEAASHADPRTTMRYERARVSLDRHATYIVAAYLAGAAR